MSKTPRNLPPREPAPELLTLIESALQKEQEAFQKRQEAREALKNLDRFLEKENLVEGDIILVQKKLYKINYKEFSGERRLFAKEIKPAKEF